MRPQWLQLAQSDQLDLSDPSGQTDQWRLLDQYFRWDPSGLLGQLNLYCL